MTFDAATPEADRQLVATGTNPTALVAIGAGLAAVVALLAWLVLRRRRSA